jgi:hypothetical protein
MMRFRIDVAALVLALGLAGCATQTRTIGQAENKGDVPPFATSGQLLTSDLTNLGAGEAIAIAQGDVSAIGRPNRVEVTVTETVESLERRYGDAERVLDLDGDGIPDLPRGDARPEGSFFDLAALKFVKSGNQWSQLGTTIRRQDVTGDEATVTFRIILLNAGNRAFRGDITVLDHLDPALRFGEVTGSARVVDQHDVRSTLALVPFIGLISLAMSDFADQPGSLKLAASEADGVVTFIARDVALEPDEGIRIDFTVRYALP